MHFNMLASLKINVGKKWIDEINSRPKCSALLEALWILTDVQSISAWVRWLLPLQATCNQWIELVERYGYSRFNSVRAKWQVQFKVAPFFFSSFKTVARCGLGHVVKVAQGSTIAHFSPSFFCFCLFLFSLVVVLKRPVLSNANEPQHRQKILQCNFTFAGWVDTPDPQLFV